MAALGGDCFAALFETALGFAGGVEGAAGTSAGVLAAGRRVGLSDRSLAGNGGAAACPAAGWRVDRGVGFADGFAAAGFAADGGALDGIAFLADFAAGVDFAAGTAVISGIASVDVPPTFPRRELGDTPAPFIPVNLIVIRSMVNHRSRADTWSDGLGSTALLTIDQLIVDIATTPLPWPETMPEKMGSDILSFIMIAQF